ncbi:helix-turn-helix domain-containing protein [Paenibacillus doosanensis]|uniref:helix-turn-helix domain-containing protein n=1 Tax=Paenibacillus doosanensis TaxID=1229154 RepID=UPI00217F72AA|nr:helix-turn-helix domain-containing protein [Paenibacillus doosanensis]MCS7460442.1 helix-turn-helix domain-containing protein [Paenibacillus doosanensis]
MKRTVFIRLLFHLTIAMVVITLLVGALVYRYTNMMLKEEVLGTNTELLDQTRKIVEQALGEVQQMASSLALNSEVQKSVWLPWNLEEEYRFLKSTSDLFTDRINSSNYLHSIYLYSAINQKLIFGSGITDLSDFAYREGLQRFLGNRSASAWEAASLDSASGSDNVISFYFTVPILDVQKKGALLINLKEDVLYNAVVNTNKRKLGNVAILNSEGEVLSYNDKDRLLTRFDQADIERIQREKEGYFIETIGGVPTLVSYMTSSFNGWVYLTLNPYDEVFKRSKEVIRTTLIISLIALLLGIVLMVLVSRTYYRPVKRMVQAISAHMDKPLPGVPYKDEFGFIGESINHLFNENEEFKAKFRGQEMILRDHVLVNLLSGKGTDPDEMLRQLQYYQLGLDPEQFIVLVVRIHLEEAGDASENAEQVRNLMHFQIRTICEETMAAYGKGVYVSQFHKHDVIIMNTGQWEELNQALEKAKELAHRMIAGVTGQMEGVALTVGIGGNYRKVSDISLSYNEAVEALLYEQLAGVGSILSIHDMQVNRASRNRFIAYRNQVDKLLADLKTGSLDKALQTKDQIIDQLHRDTQFGFSYKHMMLTHLLNSLVAVRVELVQKDDSHEEERRWYADFAKLQNLDEIRGWIGLVLEQTAGELQSKRENKNVEVIEKLVDYIRQHYREPIGLQTLADLVFMNGNYLSKVFKEVTGQTFMDFLTEIRFAEACRMLDDTERNINEIAELTGFGQKQNLIRTFKKMTGQTPTEYRNREVMERLNEEN